MTFRRYLRDVDKEWKRLTGRADRRAFTRYHPYWSKFDSENHDYKSTVWGIVYIVFGTLILGYGDLLLLTAVLH